MVSVLEWNKTMVCENMSLEVSEVVFKVSLLIILILSVLGNSAVCIIVSRHYQLRTVTNAFFVNMAAAQLLFALISIPPYLRLLSNTYSPLTNHWLCVFIGFTFEWFAASSNLALTLVIIERYFVIKHSARKKISPKGTAQLIFVAYLWTLIFAIPSTVIRGEALQCGKASPGFSLGLSCFPLLNTGKKKSLRICSVMYVAMCFLIPMALMVGLFFKISKSLWRGSKGIRPIGTGNMKTMRLGAEIKTTRTLLFITILHLCCWLPICVISLHLSLSKRQTERLKLREAMAFGVCIAFASSSINPLMYAFRNPRISIILRHSRQRFRHKNIQFNPNEDKKLGKTVKASTVWAQNSQRAVVCDNSKSEETLTTSSR